MALSQSPRKSVYMRVRTSDGRVLCEEARARTLERAGEAKVVEHFVADCREAADAFERRAPHQEESPMPTASGERGGSQIER